MSAESLQVPVSRLWAWPDKLVETLQDIREGRRSFAKREPLTVSRLDSPRGHFYVMDGHHRLVERIEEGDARVPAVLNPFVPRIERTGGSYDFLIARKVRVVDWLRDVGVEGSRSMTKKPSLLDLMAGAVPAASKGAPPDVRKLVELAMVSGDFHHVEKTRWLREGKALLRRLAADLGLSPGTFDVRDNPAGPAVSGEVILHGERIYVHLGGTIGYARACKGRKDYGTGMDCPNHTLYYVTSSRAPNVTYASMLATCRDILARGR